MNPDGSGGGGNSSSSSELVVVVAVVVVVVVVEVRITRGRVAGTLTGQTENRKLNQGEP